MAWTTLPNGVFPFTCSMTCLSRWACNAHRIRSFSIRTPCLETMIALKIADGTHVGGPNATGAGQISAGNRASGRGRMLDVSQDEIEKYEASERKLKFEKS